MTKLIGIWCNWDADIYENKFELGCGGSDTWVIQISKEFANRGYHVHIFTNKASFSSNSNIRYFGRDKLQENVNAYEYDYMIILRCLNRDHMKIMIESNHVKHIYVLPHDQVIWKHYTYSEEEWDWNPINKNEMLESYIDKYVCLSEWHKKMIIMEHKIPEDKIVIIGNGVDSELFSLIDDHDVNEIDHRILWTSIYKRGCAILVEDIAPIVRQTITDFGVDICSYDDIPNEVNEIEYVNVLPKINKEQYYRELHKHACFFYPCVVEETFGICALEAVMCNQDVISTFEHGMEDALSALEFTKIPAHITWSGRHNYFDYVIFPEDKNEQYWNIIHEFANRIIDSIMNYNSLSKAQFRKLAKNYVLERHSWKNVVDKWELLFLKS